MEWCFDVVNVGYNCMYTVKWWVIGNLNLVITTDMAGREIFKAYINL